MKHSERKTTQRNVLLDTAYYTANEIELMWFAGTVAIFGNSENGYKDVEPRQIRSYEHLDEMGFRFMLKKGDDIKVALDEYSAHYTTVVVRDGVTYYVTL